MHILADRIAFPARVRYGAGLEEHMSRIRFITQAGMIAAVYAALTLLAGQALGVLAWGPVQLRVSEAFTVVAFFTPAAIPGLTLGSVISNGYMAAVTGNPLGILDVIFGSLGTLLGAVWMWHFRSRTMLGLAGPVVSNALIVPAYLPWLMAASGITGFYEIPFLGIDAQGSWVAMYLLGVVFVGLGQSIVLYTFGWALLVALRRLGLADTWTVRS
jgi:uncharacterized membrane protein